MIKENGIGKVISANFYSIYCEWIKPNYYLSFLRTQNPEIYIVHLEIHGEDDSEFKESYLGAIRIGKGIVWCEKHTQ